MASSSAGILIQPFLAPTGFRLMKGDAFWQRRVGSSETYSDALNHFSKTTDPDTDRYSDECGHFFEKVDAAVGIAPLIVVPTHQLEESTIEFHARTGIKNRGS